jgi:hypothetical protein
VLREDRGAPPEFAGSCCRKGGLNIGMRYRDITEAAPDAQANAQRTQRDKLAAVNDKVARASQTHQNTVKAAHDSGRSGNCRHPTKTTGTAQACRTGGRSSHFRHFSLG